MTGRIIRAVLGRLTLVAGLLLLSGCWPQVGADSGHTRWNGVETALTRANVESLHEVWSAGLEVDGAALSEPVVSGGRVFVVSTLPPRAARVQALDVASGDLAWNYVLAATGGMGTSGSVSGAPAAFVDGRLWTGSSRNLYSEGESFCAYTSTFLDPATGTQVGGAPGFPSAAVSLGGAVVRTAIHLDSGCAGGSGTMLEVGIHSAGESFSPLWSAPLGSVGTPTPTLTDGQVFVAYETTVAGFLARGCGETTCSPAWTTTLDAGTSTPVADRRAGPVFVISGESLVALDRTTGATLWHAPLGGSGGGLALANGVVYATSDGVPRTGPRLLAFPADGCGRPRCRPLWTASLGGTDVGDPVVGGDETGGNVVYAANGQEVLTYDATGCDAATCAPLVTVAVPSAGPMSLAQGHLFVVSDERLTALAPTSEG